ncbi:MULTISPECIES: hypothetical protein [Streptomyces]|uniref:hypothetical protein n=1 Tax=Streptomyces TaxID=1883 RepID=UPI00131AF1CE|nr:MULTISPECIES: hypothetical protein [Streptomyces]MDW4913734.1 hypothetical protein [Streptomyces californicus]
MTEPPKMFDFDAFDRSLGWMIREAASLEMYLETIVKELCESPYGALLISGEPSSRVLNVCKVLIDAHPEVPEEHRTEFKKMLTDAKAAFERRHVYVHGAIAWEGQGIPGNVRSRRLRARQDFQPLDTSDLNQLAAEFNRLIFRAGYFLRLTAAGFPDFLPEDHVDG